MVSLQPSKIKANIPSQLDLLHWLKLSLSLELKLRFCLDSQGTKGASWPRFQCSHAKMKTKVPLWPGQNESKGSILARPTTYTQATVEFRMETKILFEFHGNFKAS